MYLNHAAVAYTEHNAEHVCSGQTVIAPSGCKAKTILAKRDRRFVRIEFKGAQYFGWVPADFLSRSVTW